MRWAFRRVTLESVTRISVKEMSRARFERDETRDENEMSTMTRGPIRVYSADEFLTFVDHESAEWLHSVCATSEEVLLHHERVIEAMALAWCDDYGCRLPSVDAAAALLARRVADGDWLQAVA